MLTRLLCQRSLHTTVKLTLRLYRGYHVPSTTLTIPTSYTIAVGPKGTKDEALQALKNIVIRSSLTTKSLDYPAETSNPSTRHSSATVILASRSLASWLDDPSFIFALIKTNARRYKTLTAADGQHEEEVGDDRLLVTPPAEMSILTAAVDSIPSPTRQRNQGWGSGFSTQGISVIQGVPDQLLAGLWENAAASHQNDPDMSAGLTFKVPDFEGRSAHGTVEVTLPVANTVFYNGRSSTMFASRWAGTSWSDYKLVEQRDVTQTSVDLQRRGSGSQEFSRITIPMLPLTQPRRIVSGLGNIVRQVEISTKETGKKTVPASMELEEKIPHMLSVREKMGLGPIEGPVGVWALVIPLKVAETLPIIMALLTHGVSGFNPAEHFRPLLEAGCRIYRVLSGGGGWGDKKGLLSLDPQTKFSTTDDEDIDSFARSFLGQHSDSDVAGGSGDIISPGDYVSFFVDTETYPIREVVKPQRGTAESFQLGVDLPEKHSATYAPSEVTTEQPATEVFLNYFGAASSQAMFVGPETFLGLDRPQVEARLDRSFRAGIGYGLSSSKIDTPGTTISVYTS